MFVMWVCGVFLSGCYQYPNQPTTNTNDVVYYRYEPRYNRYYHRSCKHRSHRERIRRNGCVYRLDYVGRRTLTYKTRDKYCKKYYYENCRYR